MNLSVLLVEDDDDLREELATCLSGSGFDVPGGGLCGPARAYW